MAPAEKIPLPFRWQFIPVKAEHDGSIRWKWAAYSQTGEQVMASQATFETLTECFHDAKAQGYGRA